jgi:hypothetical protein
MTTNEFGPVGEETSPRSANIYCLGPISHFPSHSFQFISAREKKKKQKQRKLCTSFSYLPLSSSSPSSSSSCSYKAIQKTKTIFSRGFLFFPLIICWVIVRCVRVWSLAGWLRFSPGLMMFVSTLTCLSTFVLCSVWAVPGP